MEKFIDAAEWTRRVAVSRLGPGGALILTMIASWRAGDRELERETRRELQSQFGVKLQFASELQASKEVGQ